MHVDLRYRFSWGRELFFPLNDDASFLLRLMKRNSFTLDHVKEMFDYGWKISFSGEYIENDFFKIKKRANVEFHKESSSGESDTVLHGIIEAPPRIPKQSKYNGI